MNLPHSLRHASAILLLTPVLYAAAPSTPQEQAEFLAGIDLPSSSVLAELQKSTSYKSHQAELQEKWAFCRKARYNQMQVWADANLRKDRSTHDVVRYLFGGPDFLNAFAFFPDANVMVLGGLEPVGEVPPPESLPAGSFGNALASLRQALHTSLYCGYFITSEMGGQMHHGSFRGVLPVLYTELALTGNRIQTVEMVNPFGAPGVKISYQRPGHLSTQTLYYFQSNLANGTECQRFLSWLGGLGNGPAYLKAASYLLHNEEFSQTRNFLLNTSTLIVEDDSGIPYRFFDKGGWKVQVFGDYASPLPIFSGYTQRDFRAAYSTPENSGPIAFGAGYHVVPAHANILLATRTGPLVATKPTSPPNPVSTPKPVVARTAPVVSAVDTPTKLKNALQSSTATVAESSSKRSLARLENEEIQIRADQSTSHEEKLRRLHDIWNLQLVAMGKAPVPLLNDLSARVTKTAEHSPVQKPALTTSKPMPSPSPSPTATPYPASTVATETSVKKTSDSKPAPTPTPVPVAPPEVAAPTESTTPDIQPPATAASTPPGGSNAIGAATSVPESSPSPGPISADTPATFQQSNTVIPAASPMKTGAQPTPIPETSAGDPPVGSQPKTSDVHPEN